MDELAIFYTGCPLVVIEAKLEMVLRRCTSGECTIASAGKNKRAARRKLPGS